MTSLAKVMTTRRKGVVIAVVILIALYGFISWSNHRGDISYLPVRVQSAAKALVSGDSCQPFDSDSYLVTGYVQAPIDTGVIKIGAKIHYSNVGSSTSSFDYSGWTTYFDTSDPGYRQYGSGTQEFVVLVETDSSSEGHTPTFCSISASYFQ